MRLACTFALLAFTLAACGDPPPPPEKPKVGRDETQTIRNTDAIGYAGTGIANKVDGALNANDGRKDKLDANMESQGQ